MPPTAGDRGGETGDGAGLLAASRRTASDCPADDLVAWALAENRAAAEGTAPDATRP
jgi:hypothetical protein